MSSGPGFVDFICNMTACKRYFSRAGTCLRDLLMPTRRRVVMLDCARGQNTGQAEVIKIKHRRARLMLRRNCASVQSRLSIRFSFMQSV